MTMEARIISALKRYKSGASKAQLARIVSAGTEFGEYIRRLRRKGYDIPCVMREGVNAEGKLIRFGVYVLRAEQCQAKTATRKTK